jgi:uncharacterized protein DUF3240
MMLLTIIAPPAMEEELIDWLLIQTDITGFTSQNSNGYGSGHAMSLAEQVTGRRRQITFSIELKNDVTERIITVLKKNFLGSNLHFWVVPLSQSGRV